MRYLFYNIYGDAQSLIDSKPDDVILVPFGWDKETETNRNNILESLKTNTTCLPSLMFWIDDRLLLDKDGNEYLDPAHWHEIRVFFMNKPWNWNDIDISIENIKNTGGV